MIEKQLTIIPFDEIRNNFIACPDREIKFNMRMFRFFILDANSFTEYPSENRIIFRTFFPQDRYFFDFNMDLTQWIQMDTHQDAHYYGTWCNPTLRTSVSYCEGDITFSVAKDDTSFLEMVKATRQWNLDNGQWIGADPGLNPCDKNILFMKIFQ